MPNALYIELSNGTVMVHYRPDGDYGDAATIANNLKSQHHEGAEILGWVVADAETVADHLTANGKSVDDCSVSQKKDVPEGDTMFPETGTELNDVGSTDKVLHIT